MHAAVEGLMWWIPIAGAAAGVAGFFIALAVAIFAYKTLKKRKLSKDGGKDAWMPKSIPYGNLTTVKCVPSKIHRTSSTSSNCSENCGHHDTPSDFGGTLVQTTIQPLAHERRPSIQSEKRKPGSISSSPADSSKASDDDDEDNACSRSKGKIWFSVKYNSEDKVLYVEVIKAKYLKGRSMLYSPRDPFVRVSLLPDETTYFQTKVRHRTLSPKFKETFTFQMDQETYSSRSLKLVVYDFDKKNVRHSLGQAIVPLAKLNITSGEAVCNELDDCPQKINYAGEMLLSLCCNPHADKVKATVIRLKNLPIKSDTKTTDVYIQVELFHGRRIMKTKNSMMHPGTPDMEIQETFAFGVSGRFLESCSLVFNVKIRTRGKGTTDRQLGRLAVGPFMFARGRELLHWQEMMINPRTGVEKWHYLCEVN